MAPQPIKTLVRSERLTLREVSDRYGIAYEECASGTIEARSAARI